MEPASTPWLRLSEITKIEKALEIIDTYWPPSQDPDSEAFQVVKYRLRRTIEQLEQQDFRTIERKLREIYEGK